ncbi:phosphotransferase [Marisediminicola senii]|uniref:phosphotransferase n=1 Tax=Marisediminicola senii TaxID=2711233 RepID=UPI0013EAFEA4|nr:phosphotransferase [Marisediminicola senii]
MRVPAVVIDEADGSVWEVTRAWPDKDGAGGVDGVTFEARSSATPHVRGGQWDAPSGATLHPVGVDDRLPALGALAGDGTVLVHRPGRRAVVRSADGERFTKVLRPGKAKRVAGSAVAAATFGTSFAVPRQVGMTSDTVTVASVAGQSLFDLGRGGSRAVNARAVGPGAVDADAVSAGADHTGANDTGIVAAAWNDWRHAWVTAVTTPLDPSTRRELPRRDAESELVSVREWTARIAGAFPAERTTLSEVVDSLEGWMQQQRSTATQPVLAHADLHDKQVLWDARAGAAMIDFDTVCTAEAALDLGNLRAHVALRVRQGHLTEERLAIARAAIDGTASALGVDPERVRIFERATMVRLGCLYAYRPRWAALAAQLRAEALAHPRP